MNNPDSLAAHTADVTGLTDVEINPSVSGPDLISDDDIGYEEIMADDTAGSVRFSAEDYGSDEEMMAAVEAFIMKCWNEGPDEVAR